MVLLRPNAFNVAMAKPFRRRGLMVRMDSRNNPTSPESDSTDSPQTLAWMRASAGMRVGLSKAKYGFKFDRSVPRYG